MQFPFGSRSLLHAFIVGNLCFACFASQTLGLCSAIPSAPLKFVARLSLCCIVLYSVIFCFACFASQTSDLGSAFPSAPVKSVTRFCYAENFVLRVLPKKHRVCAVLLPRLPSSFLHAGVYFALFSNFLLCVFCLTNIGLVQCFPFGSAQVYTLLVFFVLFSLLLLCVLCLTSSGLCSDFSSARFEFSARFIFCFVLFSFKFVFCVLSLTNLIFLRFP